MVNENVSCAGVVVETSPAHKELVSGLKRIPRSEWKTHVHSSNAYMLLHTHEEFRSTSKHIYDELKDMNQKTLKSSKGYSLASLKSKFLEWHRFMNDGHEQIEEQRLYPFLFQRFKISMKYLSLEHDEMHAGRDKVLAVLKELETSIDMDERRQLLKLLVESHADYDAVMTLHLLEEEELMTAAVTSAHWYSERRLVE